jgi:hypothetical protein
MMLHGHGFIDPMPMQHQAQHIVQAIFKCLTSGYFQMSRFNALGLPLT